VSADPFNVAIEVIRAEGQNEEVYMLYNDLKNKVKATASMTAFLNALKRNGRRHLSNFQANEAKYNIYSLDWYGARPLNHCMELELGCAPDPLVTAGSKGEPHAMFAVLICAWCGACCASCAW